VIRWQEYLLLPKPFPQLVTIPKVTGNGNRAQHSSLMLLPQECQNCSLLAGWSVVKLSSYYKTQLMKKLFIPAAFLATVMSVALFPSCKKKDSPPPSRSEMIVGSWKNVEEGNDMNSNGEWDLSEHQPAMLQATFTFQNNGTGTAAVPGSPLAAPFNWSLSNNDSNINVSVSLINYNLQGTIVSMTSSECIVRENTDTTDYYVRFQKQ
jgi:hypothetical protein